MNKIYKTTTLRNVAIHNLFNRTSIFEPTQAKDLKADVLRQYKYKDSQYDVKISGQYLNFSIDYPLFSIVIAKWRNNIIDKVEQPEKIKIDLIELHASIKVAGKGTRAKEYQKIDASIKRIGSSSLRYTYKKHNKTHVLYGGLTDGVGRVDFEKKVLEVNLSQFVIDLYLQSNDYTFINIEKLLDLKSERSKALYRFFSSQSRLFVDFKFDKLSRVMGFNNRNIKDSKRREYIVLALRELISHKILWDYSFNASTGTYRIVQCKHFSEQETNFVLKHYLSNFEKCKYKVNTKHSRDDYREDIPF